MIEFLHFNPHHHMAFSRRGQGKRWTLNAQVTELVFPQLHMAFKRHLYNDIVYIIRLCNQLKRWKFHSVIPQSLSLGSWIWFLSHLEWHNKRIGVMVRIRYLHSTDKILLDLNNWAITIYHSHHHRYQDCFKHFSLFICLGGKQIFW